MCQDKSKIDYSMHITMAIMSEQVRSLESVSFW